MTEGNAIPGPGALQSEHAVIQIAVRRATAKAAVRIQLAENKRAMRRAASASRQSAPRRRTWRRRWLHTVWTQRSWTRKRHGRWQLPDQDDAAFGSQLDPSTRSTRRRSKPFKWEFCRPLKDRIASFR